MVGRFIAANIAPGLKPGVLKNPPVPFSPWPPKEPNTFCAQCAAMAAPNSTRTNEIPTSTDISFPPALESAVLAQPEVLSQYLSTLQFGTEQPDAPQLT
jgi:hypothetical protein